MNTSKIGGPLRGAPALFHPRGSGIPIPEVDADTPFVILNDSEVARDMDVSTEAVAPMPSRLT